MEPNDFTNAGGRPGGGVGLGCELGA
jgi:hypothetical protein